MMRSNLWSKRRKMGKIKRMAKVTEQMSNLSMSSATVIQKYKMHASYKNMQSNKERTQAWDSWSPTRGPQPMSISSSSTIIRRRATRAHLRITTSITSTTKGHPQVDSTTNNNYNQIESRC